MKFPKHKDDFMLTQVLKKALEKPSVDPLDDCLKAFEQSQRKVLRSGLSPLSHLAFALQLLLGDGS